MAVAALAAAGWLRHPAVPYLVGGWAATAAAIWLAGRPAAARPGAGRMAARWRLLAASLGVAAVGHASWVQYTLWQVEHRWPAYETRTVAAATHQIRQATEVTAHRLTAVARLALAAPAEPGAASAALGRLTGGLGERGVIVYTGGEPQAWAGITRVATDTLSDTLGVVQTPFYTVLYATAREGARRAVATALLAAAPPADSIALALDRVVAERSGARSFGFLVAREASAGAGLALSDGAQLLARPLRLEPSAVVLRTQEQARSRGLLLLAGMLGCMVAALWASRAALAPRAATVGVALAVVAIVPLSALSNASLLFDPTNFYVAFGGPFTANVGALALTSGLLLLALLAALRARPVTAPRWLAWLATLAVVALAPVVMSALARGIAPPADGVPPELWLAWQVALFLTATTILVLGGALGRTALGTRGLSPQLAPALAGLAALAAPALWTTPGRWPGWYPLLWVAAVLALVLARSRRRLPLNAAVVAGLGTMVLVWGATAQRRVQLAERDVAALSQVDGVTSTLLDRFAMELQQGAPVTSRVDLLQRYAASDLVAAGHPIHLATWSPVGDQVEELALGADDAPPAGARALVREAQRLGTPLVQTMAANVGTRLVLAVPTRSGWATTATVAPRSRLFADDPYAALLGGQPESRAEPPYTLALAEVGPQLMVDEQPRWRRKGDELHADWITRLPTGAVLAHAEVELRPLDALIQRGTLVLLLDLAVLGLLWSLSALADGGFQRWQRLRRRRWGRSYRTQLTLALFVFFVVPAAVFTIWSSRRLTADDAESRGLLVGETLRAAGTPSSVAGLRQASTRVDAPLLLYLNGRLQAASDPLYAALAPLGWFLPPSVAGAIADGELATSSPTRVGHQQVLVGYRVLPWEDAQTVLAAPARTSELALDRRRRDFAVLVAFAAVMGALAAFALSGVAARQLARPIGALRRA
ncbi:MAG TPA: hypothetical protein VHQ45_19955, partial [Gemmatimonadaceae bacterium]|nr:hypothetical protein [Gemmatimonadaceae bacterium]